MMQGTASSYVIAGTDSVRMQAYHNRKLMDSDALYADRTQKVRFTTEFSTTV
jgi:hypothetical protein